MVIAGRDPFPHPWSGAPHGGVAPLMASVFRLLTTCPSVLPCELVALKNARYSSHVTSALAIQNRDTLTSLAGPSSGSLSDSSSGLPIVNVPPGRAIISNEILVPGIISE